jgi:hypothetical protein
VHPAYASPTKEVAVSAETEGRPAAVPIHALYDANGLRPRSADDPRPALDAAEVILGVDVKSGDQFLVYGREARRGAAGGALAMALRVLRVELDLDTQELELLCAMVAAVKGRHEYGSE